MFVDVEHCFPYVIMEEITKWIDEGSPVDIIYLDFQRAFEKEPHLRCRGWCNRLDRTMAD